MKPQAPPGTARPLPGDAADSASLTLRDGRAVQLRVAGPGERQALADFFKRLSPESRWRRFFTPALPRPELIARLCDGSAPRSGLTLVATRKQDGESRIVGTGSYLAKGGRTAEVALAVADAFQGKGLGTLLLQRLARLAIQQGFTHFWAVTQAENQPMLEVFRASGFPMTERAERSEVVVALTLVHSEEDSRRPDLPAA
jgi:GNAT superfamily N-acetyltransferase